ncbi:MAG: hypothetical protein KY445_12730, partial [Armatimonadetes bacterium]|nr:hypothetical protein [Armatimonadota bacterium]
TPYYGEIHRTFDYPEAEERFDPLPRWQLDVLDAMKIGGDPVWQQYPAPLPGKFLGTVHSIGPRINQPYPFLNAPEPVTMGFSPDSSLRQYDGRGALMWGDGGNLYLFMEPDGKIHWTIQFG